MSKTILKNNAKAFLKTENNITKRDEFYEINHNKPQETKIINLAINTKEEREKYCQMIREAKKEEQRQYLKKILVNNKNED